MTDLKETIDLMQSEDHRERFKAEYYQLKIRLEKLHLMIIKYEAGTLSFEPNTPIEIFKDQEKYMTHYLHQLEVRAQLEGIDLT